MDLCDFSGWCRLCGQLEGSLKIEDELEQKVVDVLQVNI